MSLEALLLAAMLQTGSRYERPASEGERLGPIAAVLATEAAASELFTGPQRTQATGLLLVAVGLHESGFQEDVRRCRRSGDRGRSIGLFQLMGPWAWHGQNRADICASDTLQTQLALRVLGVYREKCGASTRSMVQAYASGSCGRSSRAARDIEDRFFSLLRERKILLKGKHASAGLSAYRPSAPRMAAVTSSGRFPLVSITTSASA